MASTLELSQRTDSENHSQRVTSTTTSDAATSLSPKSAKSMDLLKPDMQSTSIIMPSDGV